MQYMTQYNENNVAGYNDLSGFSLSTLTSGGILPLLVIAGIGYYVLNSKGGNAGSLIHKKTVEEQLTKVSAEASAKTSEQHALETLLSAEKTYNEARARLKDIRSGNIAKAGA